MWSQELSWWSSIQVLPNQVSKKSFYTFEDIDLRESDAKLHKNTLYNVCLVHRGMFSKSGGVQYIGEIP